MRTAIMAFNSMILGYVSLASLHGKVFGVDPLDVNGRAETLSNINANEYRECPGMSRELHLR